MTQKVKMLKTALGVDDGKVIPDTFFEGQEYKIGPDLLAGFIEQGVVTLVEESPKRVPTAEVRETKVTAPAETKPKPKKK